VTVFFDIGGNAINGTDYTSIPNSYVVFNNSDTAILTISAIGDGIVEGVDTLWIAVPVANSGPCASIYDTTFLYISDPYEVVPYAGPDSIYYCLGQILDFTGSVNVGVPPYNYSWSNGTNNTNVSYSIAQLGSDTLILNATDACGFIGADTVYFLQQAPPPIFVDAGPDTTLNCAGQSVTLAGAGSGGVPALSLMWNSPSLTVQPLVTTTYVLTGVDDCLNEEYDSMTVFVPPYTPFDLFTADSLNVVPCLGNQGAVFGYPLSGGNAPYSYSWSTGSTDSLINVTVISNNANYALTITDACGLDTTVNFHFTSNQTPIDYNVSSERQCRNADSTASIKYVITGGSAPYTINSIGMPAGVLGSTTDTVSNTFLIDGAKPGIYTYEVTDQCGTVAVDSSNLLLQSCAVTTPNVITPNGDGMNDDFVFGGLSTHPNSELYVYNRWGSLVYSNTDYQNDWDGGGLSPGLYYYVLILTDGTTPGQFQGHINIFY
jgi:gliding motility-associated-like protein